MTVFAGTSGPNARRIGRFLTICGALALGTATIAHAEPDAADADKADEAPVVHRSTAPGVDEIVEVPRRMHHTLRATVDDNGNVELQGRRGAAAVAPAPETK